MSVFEDHQERIKNVYLKQLSLDLWEFDWPKVELKLEGLLNYPENDYAYIVLIGGERKEMGTPNASPYSELKEYEILHKSKVIGTLYLEVNYGYLYDRIIAKAVNILFTQFIKTFIVSLFILAIVHRMITRHLNKLAHFANNLSFDSLQITLELSRERQNDELQVVTDAINHMRHNLATELKHKEKIEEELQNERALLADMNAKLEHKVDKRTHELSKTNQELSTALNNVNAMVEQLKETQKQLIIREKMLATGGMVIGLAHELNTPLGVCKTSISAISDFVTNIKADAENNHLSKQGFSDALENITSLSVMCENNIDRITGLVTTFKKLSVHEECETLSLVNLHEFMKEFRHWSDSYLRKSLTLHILCDKKIEIETFFMSLHKALQALVENAETHAFSDDQPGSIYIEVSQNPEDASVSILVSDNGVGINESERQRIFEPFYTTRRNKGELGLGLNITYNIVTQALGGTIECLESKYQGACFKLTLPKTLRDKQTKHY
ncbi:ATP-binding protein [Litoribacillus peritrichatus]|uniref:histidine kinase n=1 Tax=Litoribacillus peritrichatus TaxID=718191 RepID=A0ABP7M988_9GAMM